MWDEGRLTVNRDWARLLKANRLTSFSALMGFEGGEVAKNVLRERTTTRFELANGQSPGEAFYIKRHRPSSWIEYVKPLMRLRRPILGARNEWQAILAFHEAGISTMTPVALGELGRS